MCAQVYRYAVTDTEVGSTCLNVRLLTDPRHGQVFYGTFFAFAFVLPMTLICALYARMLVRLLRRHAGGAPGDGPGHTAAAPIDTAAATPAAAGALLWAGSGRCGAVVARPSRRALDAE